MKITCVVGTRPEFIKMFPVVTELRRRGESPQVIATGQHTDLLRGTPFEDGMKPDVDLGLPGSNGPFGYASVCEGALRAVWACDKPDAVIVQGDTASAYAGAVAAKELKIPLAHVEAGIRSGDLLDPWPEEGFRVSIDGIAQNRWRFCATPDNLRNLGVTAHVKGEVILWKGSVTGNPGIDALYSHTQPIESVGKGKNVLVTLHRRESFGEPLQAIVAGLIRAAHQYPKLKFVWPVHPNPRVQEALAPVWRDNHIYVVEPKPTMEFAQMLATSRAVITDSGGVQEEAAALGIPCVVARERTDRPESVELGLAQVVGRTESGILQGLAWALDAKIEPSTVFGDGKAAPRIVEHLLEET